MLPTQKQLDILVSVMADSGIEFAEAKREFARRYVIYVLERNRGNQSKAARDLGWHRNTLSRNCHDLGVNPDEYRRKPVTSKHTLPVSYPQTVGVKTSA